MADTPDKKPSKFWSWPKSKWLLFIPIGGFVMLGVGAIGLIGMNMALHASSTTDFCNACHSHETNTRAEHEASSHFHNSTGVRAECHHCHLPNMEEEYFSYVWTKMVVSLDIFSELQGKITTPEAYNEHLPHMFEKVVRQFKENDSKYCRNCHNVEGMDLENQGRLAQRRHSKMAERGQTCIDCHYGLVHRLPENSDEILKKVQEEFAGLTPKSDAGTRVAAGD